MIIKGLMKLTLLDYPGKTACTVFTYGCNFRCPFCHNASLVTENDGVQISEEEIFSYLDKRKNILDGVCITGGEPLLNKDIEEFARKIKDKGFSLKIDTNGSNPELLKKLVSLSLVDYVAMDIKNCKEKYDETCGVKVDISKIEQSVAFLLEGNVDYEFRTTLVSPFHEEEDMHRIGKWIKGAKRYFLQHFVDSGNLIGSGMGEIEKEKCEKMAAILKNYIPCVETRGM